MRKDFFLLVTSTEQIINTVNMYEEYKNKNSNINKAIELNVKEVGTIKCSFCEDMNNNWCWNCEKPHCKKHGYSIYAPRLHLINTLCIDCVDHVRELVDCIKNGGHLINVFCKHESNCKSLISHSILDCICNDDLDVDFKVVK